jgi:drug/metabolite transporter (DMT)-like permease
MIVSSRYRAILHALFVTVLWSLSWVLIKRSIDAIPPLLFAGLRYMMAFIILLPGVKKHAPVIRKLTKQQWGMLFILGLVFYTFTQGGQFLTLKYLDAVSFSLILNFTSVLVAVLGIFFLREVPSRMQWSGIFIFLVGVLIYFSSEKLAGGSLLGFVLAIFTVSANAGASMLGRAVNRQQNIPPLVVTVVSMGIGSIILLSAGLVMDGWPVLNINNWLVILVLAVVNTAFAFTLWNKTLQVLSSVESSMINNTMLIQIALLAWLFLGEKLSIWNIVGLVLAAAGVFLANIKSSGKGKTNFFRGIIK